MGEVKTCPYCGQEILREAKKCKHCGKWLEKKCPQCGEWVNSEAKKCRYCGYWFDPWQRRLQEKAEKEKLEDHSASHVEIVENAIEEAKDREEAGCLLYVESVIIGVLFGYIYDYSWWEILLFLFVLISLLSFRVLRIIYCIGISLIWGIIGIALSPYLFDESEWQIVGRLLTEDYADYWWMGLIFTVTSLIFHQPAMSSRFKL